MNVTVSLAIACGALLLTSAAGQAQEAGYASPRTAQGHPDLHGIWQALNTAVWNLEDHSPALGVPAGRGVVEGDGIPYRPQAAAQRAENFANRKTGDPEANCKMVGVPRSNYMPYPFQIVQTPSQIVMLYEYVHSVRNIYMDSEHPEDPLEALWMGDSRGHWEGDTLVVDVENLTDQTWLDRSGNFYGAEVHIVERYTLAGPDHMLYEVTIDDPDVYTKPWKMSMPLYRRAEDNMRLLEYECYAYLEAAVPARAPKAE